MVKIIAADYGKGGKNIATTKTDSRTACCVIGDDAVANATADSFSTRRCAT